MQTKESTAAPASISGKTADFRDIPKLLVECVACAACLLCALWVAIIVVVSLLLSYANTPAVRTSCAGYWDFMLVSMLSPVIIPTLYCMLSCCAWPWQPFSGGCMLILGVACLHLTVTCSENGACMDAIRSTTPPLPWLIYMGWLKASLYLAGALSAISSWWYNGAPAAKKSVAYSPLV
jgi:hypothetical protein